MNFERLREQLALHEGVRSRPYADTVGKLTIGVGRNLTDVGLNEDEIRFLLLNDVKRAVRGLNEHFPWWQHIDDVRQRVLVDMAFNLGIGDLRHGLRSFVRTLHAIEEGRYADAAQYMLESKWAQQVGRRAQRLAQMMATGKDYTE